MIEKGLQDKILTSLSVSTLFILILFVFGPSHMYLPNSPMFSYSYQEVLFKLLPVSLIAFILITVILSVLPKKFSIHQKIVSLVLATSGLMWFQGNLIIWKYGVLDGRNINWDADYYKGIIDGLIWIFILIFVVYIKSDFFYKNARKISIFFIVVQLISTSILFFNNLEARIPKQYLLFDKTDQFNFSIKKNVVILVVDTFQSDLFQEIISEDDSYKNIFDGFTYYRNSLGGFPTTLGSIPFILTGENYDNSTNIQEFTKKAYFTQSSILNVLKNNGYHVEIFFDSGRAFHRDDKLISNIKTGKISITNSQGGFLFDLTLFRYLPHFLKKIIYNNQNWRFKRYANFQAINIITTASSIPDTKNKKTFSKKSLEKLKDIRFISDMMDQAKAGNNKEVFKFYHLNGVHPPIRMNEKLDYKELKNNRLNWKRYGKGVLKIVSLFLKELKRIKTYNNSLIFIIADHGHPYGEFGIKIPKYLGKNDRNFKFIPEGVIESAIPLILVKRINETGEIKISDNPVSLSDIPNTLFSELNIDGEFTGKSMFQIEKSEFRERRFSYYRWEQGRKSVNYLPSIKNYIVSGHSWIEENWKPAKKK